MNIKLFVLVIFFILVTGCITQRIYEGEERNSEELSVILSATHNSLFGALRWGGTLHILRVDETDLTTFPCCLFEVLPGKHTIYVGLYHDSGPMPFYWYSNKSTITFDTEAGKKYIVYYRSKDESYFITEKESGKVIYDQAGLSN